MDNLLSVLSRWLPAPGAMIMRPAAHRAIFTALVLGTLFASLTVLWEQDIWWQIRAGTEILQTGKLQFVETWSYTAAGEPWLNLQWLSTILFAWTYQLVGAEGLILVRGLLAVVLVIVLDALLRSSDRTYSTMIRIAGLALVVVAVRNRIQLRADLLNFIVFASVMWVWASTLTLSKKRWLSLGLVILSANLHPGTSPFIIVAACALSWERRENTIRWALWVGLFSCGFFLTPYTWKSLLFLYNHLFYPNISGRFNPDHQALTFFEFTRTRHFAAVGLTLLAIGRLVSDFNRTRKNIDAGVLLATTLLLIYLCFDRVRAFPYLAIWCLPAFCLVLKQATANRARWLPHVTFVLTAVLCLLSTRMPTFEIYWKWPVAEVEFIKQHNLKGRIYHGPADGGYTVWHLQNYKTFADTRETPFRKIEAIFIRVNTDPEYFQTVVEKYGIQTVLMPVHYDRKTIDQNADFIGRYYPEKDWALVAFSSTHTVYVQRIPEHEKVISMNEYKILRPNLSPFLYGKRKLRTLSSDRRFLNEIRRCLDFDHSNLYCDLARAHFIRKSEVAKEKLLSERQNLRYLIATRRDARWRTELVSEIEAYSELF